MAGRFSGSAISRKSPPTGDDHGAARSRPLRPARPSAAPVDRIEVSLGGPSAEPGRQAARAMPIIRTRIAVAGFTEAEIRQGLAGLLDEFGERPWILRPSAEWDPARARLIVTTHGEGDDAGASSRAALDEVWDC